MRLRHASIILGTSALCLLASAALATVQNVRPVVIDGTSLQNYFTSVGQTIDVNTDQKSNALWTTTLSGNSTFTVKLELGGPASAHAIGIYSDGAAATHFQIFPAAAGVGWFTVTSFDVGTPGHVVSNLFDNNAMWQSAANYYGVNAHAFGFYIEVGDGTTLYSEDDENPGAAPANAADLVYAATGTSVGSWWLTFQTSPMAPSGGTYTDALVFLESVNGPTPVRPLSWGSLKQLYTR